MLPYSWAHTFIPVVPYYLLTILIDSPSPFIFGTSASTFAYVKDIVPADVDVIFLHDECKAPCPQIPLSIRRWLYEFRQLKLMIVE